MNRTWGIRAVFLIGFLLCCFPIVNNVIEQRHQADAVATYQKAADKSEDTLEQMLSEAKEYNDMLYQSEGAIVDGMDTQLLSDQSYQTVLDISGTGTMGSLDIPKINVELPIYHGTEAEALSNGIGHLQGTSLPIGGENVHSVLTGHRGLPSSKLLVRLDEMETGDLFFVRVANETLAYRVSDIQVVKPEETSCLKIQPGKDLVSIVTCTPYGINTHRLVVTGERVAYKKAEYERIKTEIPSVRELLFTILPFAFIAVSIELWIKDRRHIDYENEKI